MAEPARTAYSAPRTPIWLDCDTGHDDAFAILLAARSPTIQLLGISTVYGNAPLESTTYNTRAILKAIGREDVPVYAGAAKPFNREPAHAPDIHGASGLDGTHSLPEPTVPARAGNALDGIYRALSAEQLGTAWLVAVGAMTNIAALFREHPDLIDHIAGLSIMGGAVGGGFTDAPMGKVEGHGERFGNHTPYAEFNIYCDPEAAHAVLSHPALASKTTLIPLDLTHQFLATSDVQMGLLFGSGESPYSERTIANAKPVRRLFFEIVSFFAKTYADVFGLKNGPPTHDPLAVAAAFRPDLFSYKVYPNRLGDQRERFHVSVVTQGEHGSSDEIRSGPSQCGRTVVTPGQLGESGILIPRGLDARSLWSLIEACLSRAEHAVQRQERPAASAVQKAEVVSQPGFGSLLDLINSPTTTLSELEVAGGFPDIRTRKSPEGSAQFLATNKASTLNVEPMRFNGAKHESDSPAAL